METPRLITDYRKWKEEHEDDYVYDEIHGFFDEQTRGDLFHFMELIDKLYE